MHGHDEVQSCLSYQPMVFTSCKLAADVLFTKVITLPGIEQIPHGAQLASSYDAVQA